MKKPHTSESSMHFPTRTHNLQRPSLPLSPWPSLYRVPTPEAKGQFYSKGNLILLLHGGRELPLCVETSMVISFSLTLIPFLSLEAELQGKKCLPTGERLHSQHFPAPRPPTTIAHHRAAPERVPSHPVMKERGFPAHPSSCLFLCINPECK